MLGPKFVDLDLEDEDALFPNLSVEDKDAGRQIALDIVNGLSDYYLSTEGPKVVIPLEMTDDSVYRGLAYLEAQVQLLREQVDALRH